MPIKPLTKQLHGVSIQRLIETNADDWQVVLPHVTAAKVDKVDFAQMTVTDFTKLCATAAEWMFEDAESEAEEIDADDNAGKRGLEADTLDITLDDSDGALSLTSRGATLDIRY